MAKKKEKKKKKSIVDEIVDETIEDLMDGQEASTGRPTKFKDIKIKQVKIIAELGWTDLQMSEFFGVDPSSWSRWKVKYKKFRETLKKWKKNANTNVERSFYERAIGYECIETKVLGDGTCIDVIKRYPPDPLCCKTWLQFRDKQNWAPENPEGVNINLNGDIKDLTAKDVKIFKKEFDDEF